MGNEPSGEPDDQTKACEAMARTYRQMTGVPMIIGSNLMRACRAIGMDTSDLREVGTLPPANA